MCVVLTRAENLNIAVVEIIVLNCAYTDFTSRSCLLFAMRKWSPVPAARACFRHIFWTRHTMRGWHVAISPQCNTLEYTTLNARSTLDPMYDEGCPHHIADKSNCDLRPKWVTIFMSTPQRCTFSSRGNIYAIWCVPNENYNNCDEPVHTVI